MNRRSFLTLIGAVAGTAAAALDSFLAPLFKQFEALVSEIADTDRTDIAADVVHAARSLVIMTPERFRRWGKDLTIERPKP